MRMNLNRWTFLVHAPMTTKLSRFLIWSWTILLIPLPWPLLLRNLSEQKKQQSLLLLFKAGRRRHLLCIFFHLFSKKHERETCFSFSIDPLSLETEGFGQEKNDEICLLPDARPCGSRRSLPRIFFLTGSRREEYPAQPHINETTAGKPLQRRTYDDPITAADIIS